MEFTFTSKAVVFFASRAFIVRESLVKSEDCTATRSGTPTCVIHMVLYVVLEGKFIVFVSKFRLQKLCNLLLKKLAFTVLVRTGYRYDFVRYFFITMSIEASNMIHMATTEVA